jgi:hypothetical protein
VRIHDQQDEPESESVTSEDAHSEDAGRLLLRGTSAPLEQQQALADLAIYSHRGAVGDES